MQPKIKQLIHATKIAIKKKNAKISALTDKIVALGYEPPMYKGSLEVFHEGVSSDIEKLISISKNKIAEKDKYITELSDFLVEIKKPQPTPVSNFPDIQKVHVLNLSDVQRVEVVNTKDPIPFPEVQKVHITNQKDPLPHPEVQRVEVVNHQPFPNIQKVEVTNTEPQIPFPDVQKVQVINPTEIPPHPEVQKVEVTNGEKPSTWVPDLIVYSVKLISEMISNLWAKGITVKLDDGEKYKPQSVIIVDARGRPVDLMRPSMLVPFPMGTSGGGNPPPTIISSGRKIVAVAGTREQLLSAVTVCRKVIITAPSSNSDSIYVGGGTVNATSGQEQGLMLVPSGSATIDIDDVSKVWIDAVVSGEGVTFTYIR